MYKILLVDDEQNVLNALRRELQSDYEIEAFSNPQEALQHCPQNRFDLVVVDHQMPGMNGIEFLNKFSKLQSDAVRIMLSGEADFDALANAVNELHIYRFISKPWDMAELAITLAEALLQREQLLKNKQLAEEVRQHRNWQQAHDPSHIYQVLVVDDESNVLHAISREITARGGFFDLQLAMLKQADSLLPMMQGDLHFNVTTFTSPAQALERAKQFNYDVVISDYLMPEMDGLTFLKALREIQPDAARILISGQVDKEVLVKAINDAEIFSFIGKPWHEYTLRNTLSQAIYYRNLLRENRLLTDHSRN
ncbi:MAG: response regulator [Gallionellaceae bacterium]|nr:response regulator [Gallionellaceae bacterium]